MEISAFFKSVIDSDTAPIVICDINHTILYMNPSAIDRYANRGGSALIGNSLLACHNHQSNLMIKKVIDWFKNSTANNRVFTFYHEKENCDIYMIALRDNDNELIGYYEKHENRTRKTIEKYKFN